MRIQATPMTTRQATRIRGSAAAAQDEHRDASPDAQSNRGPRPMAARVNADLILTPCGWRKLAPSGWLVATSGRCRRVVVGSYGHPPRHRGCAAIERKRPP